MVFGLGSRVWDVECGVYGVWCVVCGVWCVVWGLGDRAQRRGEPEAVGRAAVVDGDGDRARSYRFCGHAHHLRSNCIN
jgi:hypothetical protein